MRAVKRQGKVKRRLVQQINVGCKANALWTETAVEVIRIGVEQCFGCGGWTMIPDREVNDSTGCHGGIGLTACVIDFGAAIRVQEARLAQDQSFAAQGIHWSAYREEGC